jgi:hypothetical protein
MVSMISAKRFDWVLLSLLALSFSVNVCLTFFWRHDRAPVNSSPKLSNLSRLTEGSDVRLDRLHLIDLAGNTLNFRPDSHALPIVAYVLSPTCKWCEFNRSALDSLVAQTRGRYRFVGISNTTDGLGDYVALKAPPFPVYYVDPLFHSSSIGFNVTPRTFVFSPDGSLEASWDGAYMGKTKAEIASTFSVKLP